VAPAEVERSACLSTTASRDVEANVGICPDFSLLALVKLAVSTLLRPSESRPGVARLLLPLLSAFIAVRSRWLSVQGLNTMGEGGGMDLAEGSAILALVLDRLGPVELLR
jgi:hypothetical protein